MLQKKLTNLVIKSYSVGNNTRETRLSIYIESHVFLVRRTHCIGMFYKWEQYFVLFRIEFHTISLRAPLRPVSFLYVPLTPELLAKQAPNIRGVFSGKIKLLGAQTYRMKLVAHPTSTQRNFY